MNGKSIIGLMTLGCFLIAADVADAQVFRGRAATGHVAVGPAGGISTGRSRSAVNVGPWGSSAARTKTGTVATPGGTTVQYGKAAGVQSNPFGASAGAAKGVKVTTPSGQTYTHAAKGGVAAGPGGVAAGGSARTTVAGPYGAAGVRRSAGYRRY